MRIIPYIHEAGKLPPTLAKVPFFTRLRGGCLDEILRHSSLVECDPGEVIIREGSTGHELFVLLRGRIRITKQGEEVAVFDAQGQLVGELAVVNQETRTATVQAATHAFCLKVEPQFLETLSEEEKGAYFAALYRFVAEVLSERLAATTQRLAEVEQELEALKARS